MIYQIEFYFYYTELIEDIIIVNRFILFYFKIYIIKFIKINYVVLLRSKLPCEDDVSNSFIC